MYKLHVIFGLILGSLVNIAVAQSTLAPATPNNNSCFSLGDLRDRHGSLGVNLTKVTVGGSGEIKYKVDYTPRALAMITFEYYLCQVNGALPPDQQISATIRDAWIGEIDEAFDKIDIALAATTYQETTEALISGRKEFNALWADDGAKMKKYSAQRVPVTVANTFLSNSPKPDFMSNVKFRGHLRTLLNAGGAEAEYGSQVSDGSAMVGNMRAALQQSWRDVYDFSGGTTSAAVMVRNWIKHAFAIGSQIARIDSDGRIKTEVTARANGEALAKATTAKVEDIVKRLQDLEVKIAELASRSDVAPGGMTQENPEGQGGK